MNEGSLINLINRGDYSPTKPNKMSTLIKLSSKKETANKIVNTYAGCLAELKRQFKANKMRYVKVNKGFHTIYIVRGEGINKPIKIKL